MSKGEYFTTPEYFNFNALQGEIRWPKPVKVEYTINIKGLKYSNIVEIPRDLGLTQEEWDNLTNEKKEEVIVEDCNRWADNHVNLEWVVL